MQFSYMWLWLELTTLVLGKQRAVHFFQDAVPRGAASQEFKNATVQCEAAASMTQGTLSLNAFDAVVFMQHDGAQPGRVHGETAELLENVLRGKIMAVRNRSRGRARNLLWLLQNYVRRGLNSRVEGVRQMARVYEYVKAEFWPSVQDAVNEHSDKVATWVEEFWRTTRSTAKRAAKEHKKRLSSPHGYDEDMILDSDPENFRVGREQVVVQDDLESAQPDTSQPPSQALRPEPLEPRRAS